jgi:hypothetical protein
MSASLAALLLFAACHLVRFVAYLVQLVRLARNPAAVGSICTTTWALFAVSNIATLVYAVEVVADGLMAVIFGINAVFCLAILGLARSYAPSGGRSHAARPARSEKSVF